jgi:hypothetical protein
MLMLLLQDVVPIQRERKLGFLGYAGTGTFRHDFFQDTTFMPFAGGS